MKKFVVIVFCLFANYTMVTPSFSNTFVSSDAVLTEDDHPKGSIYTNVPIMPAFPKGEKGLKRFIKKNLFIPKACQLKRINKNVYVSFIVEVDGTISNIQLLNSIGYGCDEAALKLIEQMPNWKPGKLKGENVRVETQITIPFRPVYFSN